MTIERALAARYGEAAGLRPAFWLSLCLSETGSVQAAAAALGVPRAALRRWIAAGGYGVKTVRLCWLTETDGRRV